MNTIKSCLLVLILIVSTRPVVSQTLGDWKAYPSFSTVNAIAYSNDTIYGATLGGIFSVKESDIHSTMHTLDGMHRSDPTAMVYDEANNRLIAGYVDGTIDVINLEGGDIVRVEDIQRVTRFNVKEINAFDIYEDKLYVSTSFGIIVYKLAEMFVENSFLTLGEFTTGAAINNVDIVDEVIYAATDQGVALGDMNTKLVESSNWSVFNESDGLPVPGVDDIAVFDSVVYVVADTNIYKQSNEAWEASDTFADLDAKLISKNTSANHMAVASSSTIRLLDSEGNTKDINLNSQSSIIKLVAAEDELYAGSRNEGMFRIQINTEDQVHYLPEGPYLNFFSNIAADNSVLIAASTHTFPQKNPFNPIKGHYVYEGGEWKNFNINTNETIRAVGFSGAHTVARTDSFYYIGSWGGGVLKQNRNTGTLKVFDTSNSNLKGWKDSKDYVVASGLAEDSHNNMWMISSDSNYPLNVNRSGSDEWLTFEGDVSGGRTYFKLFVDSFDQKWVTLIDNLNTGNGRGLAVINTNDIEDPEDDTIVTLIDSPDNGNLPDNEVNAIIQDTNGEVWIGTSRGIARFIFPELVIDGGPNERRAQWLINEDTTASSRYLLRDINVSAMAVNGANQKWIGSRNQGLWLLNDDGSKILERFTKENSPLISDEIHDITIMDETGEVFISTDLGLVSYIDIPMAAVKEMKKLKVYPNPFNYSTHSRIVIEGLSQVTKLKVLGADGVVVHELSGSGGRISWDGRDYNGNKLGSGVYFIVAYEEDGREKGVGKVVIIR
ncbi:MAG: hypothetical protein FH748_15190 [Balneolaceae bacterium]|nr:hypothetical protein [Balneolaceae bacterium]